MVGLVIRIVVGGTTMNDQDRAAQVREEGQHDRALMQISTLDIVYQGAGLNLDDAIVQLSLDKEEYVQLAKREGYLRISEAITALLTEQEK